MSRFNRQAPSNSSDMPASSTGQTDHSTGALSDNEHAPSAVDVADLQRRLSQAQERRLRHQFELEQTKRQIEECIKAAEKFGVGTLEELQALVVKMEEEDRKNMQSFVRDLEEEEQKLAHIEQKLQELDRE